MLSLRLRYAPQTVWHASAFVGVFSAERFDARLFVYQPQLPSTGAFPSFYGTGCSGVAVASWTPSRAWALSARLALTQHWSRPLSSNTSGFDAAPALSFMEDCGCAIVFDHLYFLSTSICVVPKVINGQDKVL